MSPWSSWSPRSPWNKWSSRDFLSIFSVKSGSLAVYIGLPDRPLCSRHTRWVRGSNKTFRSGSHRYPSLERVLGRDTWGVGESSMNLYGCLEVWGQG